MNLPLYLHTGNNLEQPFKYDSFRVRDITHRDSTSKKQRHCVEMTKFGSSLTKKGFESRLINTCRPDFSFGMVEKLATSFKPDLKGYLVSQIVKK